MAASYIHNKIPDHTEDLVLYGEHLGINDPLTSMYIEKVLPYQRIVPNVKELTEVDLNFINEAKKKVEDVVNPIDFRAMNQNIWYD